MPRKSNLKKPSTLIFSHLAYLIDMDGLVILIKEKNYIWGFSLLLLGNLIYLFWAAIWSKFIHITCQAYIYAIRSKSLNCILLKF